MAGEGAGSKQQTGSSRSSFAAAAIPLFFAQHLVIATLRFAAGVRQIGDWWFWLDPQRLLFSRAGFAAAPWLFPSALAASWILTALICLVAWRRGLALRRPWMAALVLAPGVQPLALIALGLAKPSPADPETVHALDGPDPARSAIFAVLTASATGTAAAACLATGLGAYGLTLFVLTPFVIGIVSAWAANRAERLTLGRTVLLAEAALALVGLSLLGVAIEGIVCLIMAAPLAAAAAWLGAFAGRAMALRPVGLRQGPAACVAILPLALLFEAIAPPRAEFTDASSVDVSAPPAAVWTALVRMGPIPERPDLPFRLGIAYPVDGQIFGAGVGAIRRGVFSTGVAWERVTAWEPARRLAFDVVSDPPALRELSPWPGLKSRHDVGYFHTLSADFVVTPLSAGHSKLTLVTTHALDLAPATYWTPWAQVIVRANKHRVLDHFARRAVAIAEGRTL